MVLLQQNSFNFKFWHLLVFDTTKSHHERLTQVFQLNHGPLRVSYLNFSFMNSAFDVGWPLLNDLRLKIYDCHPFCSEGSTIVNYTLIFTPNQKAEAQLEKGDRKMEYILAEVLEDNAARVIPDYVSGSVLVTATSELTFIIIWCLDIKYSTTLFFSRLVCIARMGHTNLCVGAGQLGKQKITALLYFVLILPNGCDSCRSM